jgi:hypothetical protein
MTCSINTTDNYHKRDLDSLGWELTVCNSLYSAESPCRKVLRNKDSYGNLLYDFLDGLIGMKNTGRVIEVGGGYGYLMADFLAKNPAIRAVMLDISPFLLGKQKESLAAFDAEFIESDFFYADADFLRGFDLAVMNENCGDFPTVTGLRRDEFTAGDAEPGLIGEVKSVVNRYGLELPETDSFNFNLGAVRAVEKLCSSGIRNIFIGEHSCEARSDDNRIISMESAGNPERIRLRGHDEYTIKFSHLRKVAESFGYKCKYGPYADFLEPEFTDEIRFIVKSNSIRKDEHEIIRQFVGDLYKYEYLVLSA